ncbi:MAG: cytidine deaminase [Ilumatobacter sp.]|uniref:cytidine deaminase n=1 Tax=Ilumatobacter sp. TaxID=1967498 RepID=UPI0032977D5B
MPLSMDELADLAVEAATAARDDAYSPYSDFPMGAAVVSLDGAVRRGVLIENVSLGLAMCAERVAIFTAVTDGIEPAVLALCSKRTGGDLTFPCGACLQVALEIGGADLVVIAVDTDGVTERAVLSDLLPRAPKIHSPS